MIKPQSLRQYLEATIPELERDPERLLLYVAGGTAQSTATRALSWQYGYTLRVLVLDWARSADAVFAPLLAWVRTHQWDLLANPGKGGIRFEAEYLTTATMDLSIELDLTERVVARPRSGAPGALELQHLSDAPPLAMPTSEQWTIYLQGEPIAQWEYETSAGEGGP